MVIDAVIVVGGCDVITVFRRSLGLMDRCNFYDELLLIKEDDNIEESIEEALENNRKLMCFCNPLLQGMADWRQRE